MKKVLFGVFIFASLMVLTGGVAVAKQSMGTLGHGIGGGAGLVGTVFVPAVLDGVTSVGGAAAPAAPAKPGAPGTLTAPTATKVK